MGLHKQRTHPAAQPGCFGCKLETLQFATGPTPQSLSERTLERDLSAYKSLRQQGIQPRKIGGSADLASTAKTVFDIESGKVHPRLTEAKAAEAAEVATAMTRGDL